MLSKSHEVSAEDAAIALLRKVNLQRVVNYFVGPWSFGSNNRIFTGSWYFQVKILNSCFQQGEHQITPIPCYSTLFKRHTPFFKEYQVSGQKPQ